MTEHGKLKLREKLSYGFGDLASVLYWQTFMAYLLLFYTDGVTEAWLEMNCCVREYDHLHHDRPKDHILYAAGLHLGPR